MAKLSYVDSRGKVHDCELSALTTVGRHPGQRFQVLDRVVSKAHALVERQPDGHYAVRDNGSRNGTYVNSQIIETQHTLQNGDRITVGSTDIIYHEDPKTDPLAGKVTIHADSIETHIRSRVAQNSTDRFLPESQIHDEQLLRRDYEKLRISHTLNQSIGLEMDLEVLLDKILDKAFEIFPADRGVILLQMDDVDHLVPMVVKSRDQKANVDNVRISKMILKEVTTSKQAILSSDAMMDSRFAGSHSIILEQIRSTMSVPLLHEQQVLGVIHLDSKIASNAFTEKDLEILTGFARQAAVMIEHHRLLLKMEEQIVMREKFNRLLSPQLVDEVVSGRLEIEQGGEVRRATVMFADIRGFTTISEQLEPKQLVNLLNEYFEHMVDVIFKYAGTLDKFVGDEVMAIWGAPISKHDDAERAVRCAVEMQEVLAAFNQSQNHRGGPALDIGIGLNTGELVAGYIGSSKSMSYTVIGDPVNTASRCCDLAGPGQIMIGENSFREAGYLLRAERLPPTKLKGKTDHVDIYNVLGLKHSAANLEPTDTRPMRDISDTR
jgi:adenylate cyclase